MPAQRAADEPALLDLVPLGLPVGMVLTSYLTIRPRPMTSLPLTLYSAFLGTYLLWIFVLEYHHRRALHRLKSRPIDTFFVALVFVSALQLGRSTSRLWYTFAWFAALAVTTVIWETYTMYVGYARYFHASGMWAAARLKHWHEYEYWLVLDGVLGVVAVLCCREARLIGGALSGEVLSWLILAVGGTIGMINVFRYSRVNRVLRHTESAPS